jgi:hypothetical protein
MFCLLNPVPMAFEVEKGQWILSKLADSVTKPKEQTCLP